MHRASPPDGGDDLSLGAGAPRASLARGRAVSAGGGRNALRGAGSEGRSGPRLCRRAMGGGRFSPWASAGSPPAARGACLGLVLVLPAGLSPLAARTRAGGGGTRPLRGGLGDNR